MAVDPAPIAPSRPVSFPGASGDTLVGTFDEPHQQAQAFALFAHCFTCSRQSHAASRISRALAGRGIGVLRFDFTGLGTSGGSFSESTFAGNVEELVAAADWLRAQQDAPRPLVGHSLGGAAVLAAASYLPESRAVATLGATAEPGHVRRLMTGAVPVRRGVVEVSIGG